MEKRRILYELGDSGRDEWMFKLATELQTRIPHQPFFCCGKENSLFMKDKVKPEQILLSDYEKQTKIKKLDTKFLKEAEKKFDFNVWDLWEISAVRKKNRRKIPPDRILVWYEYLIKETSELLDKHKITDYVLYGPASFAGILRMKIMEKKGINIIELQSSSLQGRFGIIKDLKGHRKNLKADYERVKKEGPTKEEREEAVDLLQKYYENKQKTDCNIIYTETKLHKFRRYAKAIWRMIRTNHFPPHLRHFFWNWIQRYYDWRNIFENPVKGEKFVLYPLHFQPEVSTAFYGKWYYNQLNLIENIVRSLPFDYKLYVKEHSYGYGNRHLNFYREVKKYANTRLITPHFNNLELIKKSSLVITITGTAGWEAIMFQKPALIFGDVFYDIFDCIRKIKNIRDLPATIRELLDTKIDYEETLRCLSAMIKSTYPGLVRPPSDCGGHSLRKENIDLLASGIQKQIEKDLELVSKKSG